MHSSNSGKCLDSSMMRSLSCSTRRHIQDQEPSGSSTQTAAISQPMGLLASTEKVETLAPARAHALSRSGPKYPSQSTLDRAGSASRGPLQRASQTQRSREAISLRVANRLHQR